MTLHSKIAQFNWECIAPFRLIRNLVELRLWWTRKFKICTRSPAFHLTDWRKKKKGLISLCRNNIRGTFHFFLSFRICLFYLFLSPISFCPLAPSFSKRIFFLSCNRLLSVENSPLFYVNLTRRYCEIRQASCSIYKRVCKIYPKFERKWTNAVKLSCEDRSLPLEEQSAFCKTLKYIIVNIYDNPQIHITKRWVG